MAEKPQKLSLKRWRGAGSTRGLWPVKELPGILLQERGGKWYIEWVSHVIERAHNWPTATWGKGWELKEETLGTIQQMNPNHPTRRAALIALETALGEKPKRLSLKRWKGAGSTKGLWPVKQLPGVLLQERGGEWRIEWVSHLGQKQDNWATETWGEGWELNKETLGILQNLKQNYPTRRAALLTIEAAICAKPGSSLGEIIT